MLVGGMGILVAAGSYCCPALPKSAGQTPHQPSSGAFHCDGERWKSKPKGPSTARNAKTHPRLPYIVPGGEIG